MTCKASIIICLFCFFATLTTWAQQADFFASAISGCSPLAVSFTNTSTGFSSEASYAWTFGNTNSSTLKDPGTTYLEEGEYSVTLTVSEEGSQSFSKSMTITVYKKPVVDFSVNVTKGCAPLAVTFSSQSTPGDGTISSYTWDYGDGIAEKGESVQLHTYNISKVISPSLTVTNSYGCYSTLPKPQLIEVLPSVYAAFKPAQTVLCNIQTPLIVSNITAGDGTLSYHWDFGDGGTSDQKQPQHTFSQPGSYPVKLSAENTDGCSSDTTIIINAADYHTDFSVPSLLCQNTELLFEDKSTPTPASETWLINGAPIFDTVPGQLHHVFNAPGNYRVQLNTLFETCPSTATKQITLLPAPSAAGFVARLDGSCGSPVGVTFIDTAANASGWQWNFTGNGTATDNKQQISYTYTADGTYNVTLKRTNSQGCSVLVKQPVVVGKLEVKIESSEGNLGCETKQTIFSALSLETISQYNWNFGDGGTSTAAKPEHLFTSTGTFNITLDYVTQSGCAGKAEYSINIYEKPVFDFTAINGTNICGSTPVGFNVTGNNLEGTYFWNYGDSGRYEINSSAPYSHQYQYDSVFTVSLIIVNDGCRDTVTKQNYLTVVPPFPHISSVVNTCSGNRGLVTFSDTSKQANSWSWDFGDNSAPLSYSTSKPQVQHTYQKSGHYIASLTTTNGACQATVAANVYVLLKQQPLLSSANTIFCGSDIFHTSVTGIDSNPQTSDSLGYTITSVLYGDGSLFGGNVYITDSTISQNGFGVNLINTNPEQTKLRIITNSDIFGCADTTAYLSFQALGPVAGFSLKENNVCFKTPVVFTDASRPTHNSPIVKWNWQFGDSTSQANILGTTVSHRYPEPGTFVATLTVTDAKGCSATTPADDGFIIVKGPKAAFSVSDDQVLPLADVWFYNHTNTLNTNSSDNKYTWSFGDGNMARNQGYQDSLFHSYAMEGIDTVKLIAANAVEHCSDTASQVVYVKNPNLSFVYTTSFINPEGGCPPVIGSFTSTSKNTTRIAWDFGDGGGITGDGDAASHVYSTPGFYKVILYGYFIDGTRDSVFEIITIKGPYASLSAVKPFACGAEPITLTASSANTRNFTWDFGDGTVISNSDTFATHRYLTPNIYTPSLIVSDGSNCKFAYFPQLPIIIDTLHLDINKQPSVTCDSSLLLFTPATLSLAKDSLHLPITYHWDFGTGNAKDTAGKENVSFTYNTPGSYEVILSGASPYGCTDITRDTIVVQPTPKAFIAGTPEICENDTAIFTATATREVSWQWQFGNGNTSLEQNPAPQVYTKPGLDSVSLIVNDNGCYDTAWHRLLVNAKPDVNPSPLSAHLCQNDSVQLQAHDGAFYQWTPATNISGANTATPYVYPDTATTYYVDVKNGVGCTSRDSISVTVTPRFTVAAPSPFYICPGGFVQLSATGADSYHWLDGDALSNPDVANPTTSLYEARTYTVVGSDRYGCFTDTAAARVLTSVIPTADAGIDITTFAGNEVLLHGTGSSDVVKWQWLPASHLACDTCPNTILTPHADMEYVLKVTNAGGCAAYDSLHVTILCKAALINVPSAFTPNGDGRNDYFSVLGRGIKEIQHFAVFDRYGNPLFEQSHQVTTEAGITGWDGTYKGKPMPSATYVYIAQVVCDTGEVFPYKGTVVLIR